MMEEHKYRDEDDPFSQHQQQHQSFLQPHYLDHNADDLGYSSTLDSTVLAATVPHAFQQNNSKNSSPQPPASSADIDDSLWFQPQHETGYKRSRGNATTAFPAESKIGRNSKQTTAIENEKANWSQKQIFIEKWKQEQEQTSTAAPLTHSSPFSPTSSPPAAAVIPVKPHISFHRLPADASHGPQFHFFSEDEPHHDATGIDAMSTDEYLSTGVQFITLSPHLPINITTPYSRLSTWSKLELAREGMKYEDRNVIGTAEEVVYETWKRVNEAKQRRGEATKGMKAMNGGATIVYEKKLSDGRILLTSSPPTFDAAPPKPTSRSQQGSSSTKAKIDISSERLAMSAHDWNVSTVHDPSILNPYDPHSQRQVALLKQEEAKKKLGLFGGMTKREKQSRIIQERERMVYEDCNAKGAVRRSPSWQAVQNVGRREYERHKMQQQQLQPSITPLLLSPQAASEAWKLHYSTLKRERSSMKREDIDARSGTRYKQPLNEWQQEKVEKKRVEREKNAMQMNDVNMIQKGGVGVRQGIYTAHLGVLNSSKRRGMRYSEVSKVATTPLITSFRTSTLSSGVDANKKNLHSNERKYKRHHSGHEVASDSSSLLLPLQSSSYSPPTRHGESYTQRPRRKYRHIDAKGFFGDIEKAVAVLNVNAAAATAGGAVNATSLPSAKPVKKHLSRSSHLARVHRSSSSPADDLITSTNFITPHTLIPRYNEPDSTPASMQGRNGIGVNTAASALTNDDSLSSQESYFTSKRFHFTPPARYYFGPAIIPRSYHLQPPLILPVFGSLEEDIACFPITKRPTKALFQSATEFRGVQAVAEGNVDTAERRRVREEEEERKYAAALRDGKYSLEGSFVSAWRYGGEAAVTDANPFRSHAQLAFLEASEKEQKKARDAVEKEERERNEAIRKQRSIFSYAPSREIKLKPTHPSQFPTQRIRPDPPRSRTRERHVSSDEDEDELSL